MWNKKIVLSVSAVALIVIASIGASSGGLMSSAVTPPAPTVEELEGRVFGIKSDITRLNDTLASYDRIITTTEGEIVRLTTETTNLAAALTASTTAHDNAVNAVTNHEARNIAPNVATLATKNAEKTRLNSLKTTAAGEIKRLTAVIKTAESNLKKQEAALKKISAKNVTAKNTKTVEIVAIKESLATNKSTLATLVSLPLILKKLTTEISNLEQNIASARTELTRLTEEVAKKATAKTAAKSAYEAGERALTRAKTELMDAQATKESTKLQLKDAQAALTIAGAAYTAAETSLATAVANTGTDGSPFETGVTPDGPFNNTDDTTDDNQNNQENTDGNEEVEDDHPNFDSNPAVDPCSTINDRMDELQVRLTQLYDEITRLESSQRSSKADLATLRQRADTANEQMTELEEERKACLDRYASNLNDCATIAEAISNAREQLVQLHVELQRLKDNANLENSLDYSAHEMGSVYLSYLLSNLYRRQGELGCLKVTPSTAAGETCSIAQDAVERLNTAIQTIYEKLGDTSYLLVDYEPKTGNSYEEDLKRVWELEQQLKEAIKKMDEKCSV